MWVAKTRPAARKEKQAGETPSPTTRPTRRTVIGRERSVQGAALVFPLSAGCRCPCCQSTRAVEEQQQLCVSPSCVPCCWRLAGTGLAVYLSPFSYVCLWARGSCIIVSLSLSRWAGRSVGQSRELVLLVVALHSDDAGRAEEEGARYRGLRQAARQAGRQRQQTAPCKL